MGAVKKVFWWAKAMSRKTSRERLEAYLVSAQPGLSMTVALDRDRQVTVAPPPLAEAAPAAVSRSA
jgi:hypothetical protein